MSDVPLEGHEYPVRIGRSFDDDTSDPKELFCTFRYDFQPASIDRTIPGLVVCDSSDSVQVSMGTTNNAGCGISFKGKVASNKRTECLLVFDGESFSLEHSAFTFSQLRHVRNTNTQSKKRKIIHEPTTAMKQDSKQIEDRQATDSRHLPQERNSMAQIQGENIKYT
uniref:Uncharacterized protein AlNc14C111G6387 n=1 Tax=Albugo laibachii Nc14 TaxID=890382 RepID=F0WII7_9STRA|nr:conserved hypothetical protein [Albugo laibachii Nc14]|eukprot:CCA21069.1 conserved hypothetical protein [Albugo laibachii Nc14]